MESLEEYRSEVTEDIRGTVGSKPVQPILFVGSGLSRRYFSGPSWDELLSDLAAKCPKLEHNYGYYRQSRKPPEMGSLLADRYSQWAWDQNERKFSDEDYGYEQSPDIYLKTEIGDEFAELTPDSVEDITDELTAGDLTAEAVNTEIELLRDIQPHAVITTNRVVSNDASER